MGSMSPEMERLIKGVAENNEALTNILSAYGNSDPSSIPVTPELRKSAAAVGEDTGSDLNALLQRRIMSEE